MSWARREVELTPQQAIEMARKELSPYWVGSDPLLIGLEQQGAMQAFPLDRDFIKQFWLILIVDPTTFWGSSVVRVIQEWESRYRSLSLKFLVIYSTLYEFQREPSQVHQWVSDELPSCVQCLDANSNLVAAFRGTALPKALLFNQGQKLFETSSPHWISDMDLQIHLALRMTDPGLPLQTNLKGIDGLVVDNQSIPLNLTSLSQSKIQFLGDWSGDETKIWTQDPNAAIQLVSPGSEVAVLARPQNEAENFPQMSVELNGLPPYDSARGSSIRVSDALDLSAHVNRAKLFSLLVNLPAHERDVTIRFKDLKDTPLEVYGLRFGERMKVKL